MATEEELAKRRRRDKLRKMGRPNLVTPAEFDRLRRRLTAARTVYGMSTRAIVAACPEDAVHPDATTIGNILRGEIVTVRRSTYNALMRARLWYQEDRYTGAEVPSVGTVRRLRALQADGFPGSYLCTLMGVEKSSVPEYAQRSTVKSSTRRRVAALYEKLAGVRPEDVLPVAEARRMRTIGRKRGWPPRGCWDPDTIDDPGAHPEWTGACGTAEGVQIHRREGIPVCDACRAACPTAWVDDFDPVKLRALRTAKGLSLRGVAAELGYAYRTMQTWESGERTPTWGKIGPVLSLLDATITDVQTRKESG